MIKQQINELRTKLNNIASKYNLYVPSKKDIKRMCYVAADAYKDYDLHMYFMNGKYDFKSSEIIMEFSLKSMWDNLLILCDSKEINGFYAVVPYAYEGMGNFKFFFSGAWKFLFRKNGIKTMMHMDKFEVFATSRRKVYSSLSDWYGFNLTITKSHQGKGISKKLLDAMNELAKKYKASIIFETNSKNNIELYKHLKYEILEEKIFKDKDSEVINAVVKIR